MKVPIGKYEVTIKDSLTWGDMQKIQNAMAAGAQIGASGLTGYDATAMTEAKYVLLELAVQRVADGTDETPFTREWMDNLGIEEGDTLYAAVDALSKKK